MKRTLLSSFTLLILGFSIWWMSANVIWLGDDLDYKYMMKGEIWQSWGKIKTVKAFFDSQWIHYQHVNGRYVAHALVQLFNARLGQPVFAVCNGIVYMLFAMLIAKAGGIRLRENPGGVLSAVCISVLCFITKMMPTCQIGYIWGMAANTGWLMLFFTKSRPSWPTTFGLMLTGVIVGDWQESVSIGVCGGLGVWWIVQLANCIRHNDSCFDWRRSWILLGYVVGTASNCLAPSTMGRVADIEMPFTDQLLIASYSFPAIVLFTWLGYSKVLEKFSSHSCGCTRCVLNILKTKEGVLFVGMLFLIIFNIAIGIYSNRQLFGANLFAAILTLRLLPHHKFGWLLNTLASLAVVAFWALMIHGIREVCRQYNDITKLHAESSDGSVYYDRTRIMTIGFPLRAKYYEDILGQFDNDLHHSLMKDFKHTKKGKTMKLKPTALMEEEYVKCYAPGHFTVTLKVPPKGEAPREVMVYGHYPLGISATPKKMEVPKYSNRYKSYGVAFIIPEFPFFTADSIHIIPYN